MDLKDDTQLRAEKKQKKLVGPLVRRERVKKLKLTVAAAQESDKDKQAKIEGLEREISGLKDQLAASEQLLRQEKLRADEAEHKLNTAYAQTVAANAKVKQAEEAAARQSSSTEAAALQRRVDELVAQVAQLTDQAALHDRVVRQANRRRDVAEQQTQQARDEALRATERAERAAAAAMQAEAAMHAASPQGHGQAAASQGPTFADRCRLVFGAAVRVVAQVAATVVWSWENRRLIGATAVVLFVLILGSSIYSKFSGTNMATAPTPAPAVVVSAPAAKPVVDDAAARAAALARRRAAAEAELEKLRAENAAANPAPLPTSTPELETSFPRVTVTKPAASPLPVTAEPAPPAPVRTLKFSGTEAAWMRLTPDAKVATIGESCKGVADNYWQTPSSSTLAQLSGAAKGRKLTLLEATKIVADGCDPGALLGRDVLDVEAPKKKEETTPSATRTARGDGRCRAGRSWDESLQGCLQD